MAMITSWESNKVMIAIVYSEELANAESFLNQKLYGDAVRTCEIILEHALKDLYLRAKLHAASSERKRLSDIEENFSSGALKLDKCGVDQLLELFHRAKVPSLITTLLQNQYKSSFEPQYLGLVEIRNRCIDSGFKPTSVEVSSFYFCLKIFLEESGLINATSIPQESPKYQPIHQSQQNNHSACPACGEPVRKNWKICPSCETPLSRVVCFQCGLPVKENWKRCPECEARLTCPSCGTRIPDGYSGCPQCELQDLQKPAIEETFTDPVTGMEFVRVCGGIFKLGDTFGDGAGNELPVHEVQVDAFFIGKYPVTQSQWQKVMSTNPSQFHGSLHPVEQITWHDVQTFINKLTGMSEGKIKYRLPTESEWEYAARSGGKNEKYAGGGNIDAVAWYDENSNDCTHPVGEKAPNGCGIYDMSGNVWEWCLDKYREDAYELHSKENPFCSEGGSDQVIRGGSWHLDAWSARCARRFGFPPDYCGPALGFRLVKTVFI